MSDVVFVGGPMNGERRPLARPGQIPPPWIDQVRCIPRGIERVRYVRTVNDRIEWEYRVQTAFREAGR